MAHAFILQSGIWLGEGVITFSNAPEKVIFYTKWNFAEAVNEIIHSNQEVEMQGVEDKVRNQFAISDITDSSFLIQLQNEDVGTAMGKGVIDEANIAWEFREPNGLEGYEVFKKLKEDEYTFHAEYASTDKFRTIIDGRVWKKST